MLRKLTTCHFKLGTRLVSAGLAGPWAIGVFVLAGQVASDVGGLYALTAFVITAVSSVLVAMCYSEFFSRYSSNLYQCFRESLSPSIALTVGWLLVLGHVATLAACSRALSATMDYITGRKLQYASSQWLMKTMPALIQFTPDPLAVGVNVVLTVLFVMGLEQSYMLRLLLNSCIWFAVCFFSVFGSLHTNKDKKNLLDMKLINLSEFVTGTAMSSLGFLGFMGIATESKQVYGAPHDNTKATSAGSPRRLERTSSIIAIFMTLISYLSVTTVLTMMVNFRTLEANVPLVQAFEVRDVEWARLLMATLSITAFSVALIELFQSLHQLLRRLAIDGLLPRRLARKWPITSTSVASIVLCGTSASLLCLVVPLKYLLQLAATSPLLVHVIVATATIHLRYQPLTTSTCTLLAKRYEGAKLTRGYQQLQCNLTGENFVAQNLKERLIPGAIRNVAEAFHKTKRESNPDEKMCLVSGEDDTEDLHEDGEMPIQDIDSKDPLKLRTTTSSENTYFAPNDSELSGYETDSSTDIDAVVAEYKEKIKVVTMMSGSHNSVSSPQPESPTAITGRRATIALAVACVGGIVVSVGTLTLLDVSNVSVVQLLLLGVPALTAMFMLLLLVSRQPQATPSTLLGVTLAPCMPWLPAFAALVHLTLFLQLLTIMWLPLLLWVSLGLILYGVLSKSRKEIDTFGLPMSRQERIRLQPPPPPRQCVVPTLVPCHQNLSRENHKRLTRVDTILISR